MQNTMIKYSITTTHREKLCHQRNIFTLDNHGLDTADVDEHCPYIHAHVASALQNGQLLLRNEAPRPLLITSAFSSRCLALTPPSHMAYRSKYLAA